MSKGELVSSDSIDMSDTSPLVSGEFTPNSRSYGGLDLAVVFETEQSEPTGSESEKSIEKRTSHLTEDDVIQDAKFGSTYQQSRGEGPKRCQTVSRKNPGKYLQSIREMPWSIREKLTEAKNVRKELGNDYFKSQQKRHLPTKTFKNGKAKWEGSFGLLDKSIKKIQAYYGSGVASYFIFLRRLLWLDVFIVLITIGFICIPQIILEEGTILDLTLNGLGVLQNSLVFYGYYEPTDSFDNYEMPLAYLLTVSVIIGLSVIIIVIWMTVNYRKSKLSETEVEYSYSWRMFSSWDYSISSSEGTIDRQVSIRTDIQEVIWEHKIHVEKGFGRRVCVYCIRLITNLGVLALLAGSGYAIYFVSQNQFEDGKLGAFQEFFEQYQLSMVVAGLKLIMPPVLAAIAVIEDWTPRVEFNITLGRTMFFYFASLLVFILSLFKAYETETSVSGCLNVTSVQPAVTTPPPETDVQAQCWETEVGQEIFKLMLIDLAITLGALFVFDVLRALLVKTNVCCNRVTYKSFNVTAGVLDTVYNQGLIWLGVYFSPLIPLFGLIKLLTIYGIMYVVARRANVPPKQLYRASRSGNFSMAILLTNLFVCIYPLMVVVFQLRPSRQCGPFRAYCFVHEVLTAEIGDVPDWLSTALGFISSPEVIIPVILLLILIVIYYKTKSSSYKSVIEDLRDQLKFERRDVRRRVYYVARATEAKLNQATTVARDKVD